MRTSPAKYENNLTPNREPMQDKKRTQTIRTRCKKCARNQDCVAFIPPKGWGLFVDDVLEQQFFVGIHLFPFCELQVLISSDENHFYSFSTYDVIDEQRPLGDKPFFSYPTKSSRNEHFSSLTTKNSCFFALISHCVNRKYFFSLNS